MSAEYSDGPVLVESYGDVLGCHDEITSKDELSVVDALNGTSGDEIVVWLAEWLASEKDLKPVGSSDQVFAGVLVRETEKAWQLAQDGESGWIPKSQAVAFEREPDATLSTPQQRLGNHGGSA